MTLDKIVTITIPGKPATKGSMKCVGRVGKSAHVLVESHASADPWRRTVAGWVTSKWPIGQAAASGQPLAAEVAFTLDRPASHYGTGKNARTIKPAHRDAWPAGHNTGDVDKLVRLILDALQDGPNPVVPDDAAVVVLTTAKRFVGAASALPWPGVRIRLRPAGVSDS